MTQVLQCLKKHGQRLDLEIAVETGIALATVRKHIAALEVSGAVVTCNLTRIEDGKRIDALICRISGCAPPAAPTPPERIPTES